MLRVSQPYCFVNLRRAHPAEVARRWRSAYRSASQQVRPNHGCDCRSVSGLVAEPRPFLRVAPSTGLV